MGLLKVFLPPEIANQSELEVVEEGARGGSLELMRRLYFERLHGERDDALDQRLVAQVLDHARQVIAHPSRPLLTTLESYLRYPEADLALEETLEETPFLDEPSSFLVERSREKPFSCVTMLDCSSSMSGDKHLLASIAVAVLLLEVPSHETALSVFSSQVISVKDLMVSEPPETTVLRFLKLIRADLPTSHAGSKRVWPNIVDCGVNRVGIGILISDGRSTEGGDPNDIAHLYDFLMVLHLHGPGSHLEASQEMAQRGNGVCLEVESFDALPGRLYEALRRIARG